MKCNECIKACNAIMIFGVHGWSFQPSSLIKSRVQNRVSTMATSTSSSTSSNSLVNVMNQPLLLLSNMANMIMVKLDNTNYIVWKHQISMVLECLNY